MKRSKTKVKKEKKCEYFRSLFWLNDSEKKADDYVTERFSFETMDDVIIRLEKVEKILKF